MKRFRIRIRIRYDWVLFALLMLFLFASMLQKWKEPFSFKPLGGVIEPTPKPELTYEAYRNNTYQAQLEQYAGEHFGFREPVIRIYNQYLWTAYHKTYCNFITPGKKGWLYYKSAVDDYFGTELKGHFKTNEAALSKADDELEMMGSLCKILKDNGITFVAFIAPDKPWVYPEYLPRHDTDTTFANLAEYYDQRMTELGIPHINMTPWFVAMRDTVPFPLFSKAESHWQYSAIYGYDSLFRYMSAIGEPDFPRMHIGPPVAYKSDNPEGDENTLNLLFRIQSDKIRYKSEITVEPMATRKPRVLFVGDSFIWSLENILPFKELLDDKDVWYYNSTAFIGIDKVQRNVKEINRLRHILKADYVVVYSAGHQWHQGTFGFAKDALKQFEQATPTDIAKARLMNEIERDKDWLLDLKMYASIHDMDLEETMRQEADNILENKALLREGMALDTAEVMRIRKEEIIRGWRHSPDQVKRLEDKAKMNGKTLEKTMEDDAQWVVEHLLEKGELF